MFFAVTKVFWFFFAPSHLILWGIAAAAVLLFLRRERAAKWCATASAAFLICLGMLPFGVWIAQPLENAFPRPDWPARVDGILVLGGGLDTPILRSRGAVGADIAIARDVSAYEVARRYPNARVVFTGGSWDPKGGEDSESIAAAHVFRQMGLDPRRLTLEGRSRNTWENFQFSKEIAKPKPGDVWVLATSAYHLPRAMRIAKRVGWRMVPWPTDYLTARNTHYNFSDIPKNLDRTDRAVHEWIGYLGYRLSRKA
jgi:uncharacterized SAM-binding protein YcdF (DUF218 family)